MKLQGKQNLLVSRSVFLALSLALVLPLSLGCETKGRKAPPHRAGQSHQGSVERTFIDDPSKRDKGRLWCKEHSRYEDRCWLCHPELEDKGRPYCKEHSLYEDECFLCHPELKAKGVSGAEKTTFINDPTKRDKGRLWCKEHSRYEDRCWLCHPELEDEGRPYCKEHSLYEDECFLCHPELKAERTQGAADQPATDNPRSMAALFCNEHRVPEVECAICQPDLATALKPGGDMKVRFPSKKAANKAGIRTEHPVFTVASPGTKAYFEVQYNQNRMARITPLADGVVHDVVRDVGDRVEEGDLLVVLHSAELAQARSEYLSALVGQEISRETFERERKLKEQRISAEQEFLAAQAAYRKARLTVRSLRQRLLNFGISPEEVARIEYEQDASADFRIRAPFAGTLVERNAVAGEAVKEGHRLFTVADLTTRWLALSVPAHHTDRIRIGQTVIARMSDLPDTVYTGKVTWVGAAVDPLTRMLYARAVVSDPDRRMKTGLFGDARIEDEARRAAAILPRDAVHAHEGSDFVFVQRDPDLFLLRRVVLGGAEDGNVHILAGLTPNEPVVVDNSFIVMSEFLKSRLGAGCVDD